MNSKILLRIAAVLLCVHLAGHTAGHLGWDKATTTEMATVIDGMKQVKEPFMGALRSKADYFSGYSLIMFFVLAMSIVVLWVGSNKVTEHKGIIAPFIYAVGIAYIGIGLVEISHFFAFAACISLLAGLLAIVAVARK